MKCSHCGSSRVTKAGKLKRKYLTRQGYRCKDCKRFFVERDGFVGSRILEEFEEFFKEMKERIGEQIHAVFRREKHKPPKERRLIIFVSDKLWQYRTVFNRYFCRIARLVHGVPIACRRYGLKHNNNPIERHNEDIKQRYKTMRHFKSAVSADAFLKLRRVMYNFIRSHRNVQRKTPAEMAGLQFVLGENKLAGLIQLCIAP